MNLNRMLTTLLVIGWCLLFSQSVFAENIDPGDDGSQFAWAEHTGWLNAEPGGNGGRGIIVEDSGLRGYIWSETTGWVSLSCENSATCGVRDYGVTNNSGTLAGYAWSEHAGWISFSCTNDDSCTASNYGVAINTTTGEFSGRAWNENTGWISFRDLINDTPTYGVTTSWLETGEVCGDGNVDGGEACDDGNTENGDCCSSECQYESAGLECGLPGDGFCDAQDTCDGLGYCVDRFTPIDTECNGPPNTSGCDVQDTCNGTGTCESNNAPTTTLCRADAGECDVEDFCDGAGNCPADAFEPSGTFCGNNGSECFVQDTCDAVGICTDNGYVDAGVSCQAQADDLLVGSHFTHEILSYDQQTGSFITIFAEDAKLQNPAAMVFGPDGNLYIASQFTDNVVRFDGQTGAFIDEFVMPADGGLDFPTFMVFGPDGNLYISSLTDQVLRFDGTTGAFIDVFAEGNGLDDPFGMAFGPDGHFYVASFRSDEIQRYDGTTGAFIDVFASANSASFHPGSSFTFPSALVFGPDDNLYVLNNTTSVVRFNGQTGAFIDEFVEQGSGGLVSGSHMIFGPDDHLYLSDFFGPGSATGVVLRYDGATGDFIDTFVPIGSGGLDGTSGLAFIPLHGMVGGTLTGLSKKGSIIIQNNDRDDLLLDANGPFIFSGLYVDYNVTILDHLTKTNQICEVFNGSGVTNGANVTDIEIVCPKSNDKEKSCKKIKCKEEGFECNPDVGMCVQTTSEFGVPRAIDFGPGGFVNFVLIDADNSWLTDPTWFVEIEITGLNGGFAHHGMQLLAVVDGTVFHTGPEFSEVVFNWTADSIPRHVNEIYTACSQVIHTVDGQATLVGVKKCVDYGPF